ncbi:MAG TPA: HlyD family efflux transporter periplasmic adaptor subunit [Vicinamibacterales bacterium]|nr:HlyD family efflux transporter periplasmic adaptor subunit [Vicinamibacterales bacterium]
MKRLHLVSAVAVAGIAGLGVLGGLQARAPQQATALASTNIVVKRHDFVRSLRLSGTVEAVQATTIATPRLAGQNSNTLVVMSLVRAGQTVRPGDLIVEFDRQEQIRNSLDRQADLNALEQQIRKRQAQEDAARAADDSTMMQAESALSRARLEMLKNEMLPKIQVEKNTLALEETDARLKALKQTYDLKRRAARADIQVLEIRRDRSANAMRQAASNADRMQIKSPISGIAVIKTTWKGNNMAEIQEGDEVRTGVPVVDIVNPATMRVRARVNQADVRELKNGQAVRVGLDAYPELSFTGAVDQISPIGVQSSLSPKVRNFIVLISVVGAHPNLMPDLTASLDVELSRAAAALVIPRDAVAFDGAQAYVKIQKGNGFERRDVAVGARNTHEIVVESGLAEGAVVARNAADGVIR